MAEVDTCLKSLRLKQQQEEVKLKQEFDLREKQLRTRIEDVITLEQNKVNAKLAAERKVKEEAEMKKKLVEDKQRAEIEKKNKEAAERTKKADEEKARVEAARAKVEADKKATEAEAKAKQEASKAEESQRKSLGVSSAEDDWKNARRTLLVCSSLHLYTLELNFTSTRN